MTDIRVAIFWDLENCRSFSAIPPQKIITNIRNAAHVYGKITSFRAYIEVTSLQPPLRSLFQSSGVSIIDCPHNGRKEVADQMMLVDIMAHAMDNNPTFTIFLITGDRDFAYLVSILTLRQYHVVLIVPTNHHSSLTYQASAVLDWNTQILQSPSKAGSANSSATESTLTPSNSAPQPLSLPNTFPPSTQTPDPVGVFHLSRLATTVTQESALTRKQKRLLKIQSKISPEPTNTFATITSTSDAQNNQSLPVEPTFQQSSTSTLAIPNGQTKADNSIKATCDVPFHPFSEKDIVNSKTILRYQSITAMPEYRELSMEELRVGNYLEVL